MSEGTGSRRVVLITGASKGIGRLCAERLAASGWRVFGAARSPAQIDGVEMIEMDVDDDASVAKGIAFLLEKAGRLDALVNNAGFSMRGAVEDVSLGEAKEIFETNFFGALRVIRAAAPALRESRGVIVNMSSIAGRISLPFTAHYCASKAALEAMSESLRFELRPFGVRVAIVEPGDYKTEIHAARRLPQAAGNSVHRERFDFFLRKRRAFEERATTAEPVAALVEKILDEPDPGLRHVIAMPSQWLPILLKRFAPPRVYEWSIRRIMCP